jgi:hypothetical protein
MVLRTQQAMGVEAAEEVLEEAEEEVEEIHLLETFIILQAQQELADYMAEAVAMAGVQNCGCMTLL